MTHDTYLVALLHEALTDTMLALQQNFPTAPCTQLGGYIIARDTCHEALHLLVDTVERLHRNAEVNAFQPGWDQAHSILTTAVRVHIAAWRADTQPDTDDTQDRLW